jgi:predicted nucleotidyltransferase
VRHTVHLMRTAPPATLPLFRSDVQARLLGRLFSDPHRRFTLAELDDDTGHRHRSTLQRELARLVGAGLVERAFVGRAAVYRAATESPLYEPLRELIERTLGVESTLRDGLRALPEVEAASLVGSWARGELQAGSDIDVLVIGAPPIEHLVELGSTIERRSGREVHWLVYERDEAQDHVRRDSGFFLATIAGPSVPLVGDVQAVLRPGGAR